jgi:hypothetical protein
MNLIKVGDGIPNADADNGTFTIRIIPVISSEQTPPGWCSFGVCSEPQFVDTSSSGGGCTINKEGQLDPTLFVLFLAALLHVWRRKNYADR